MIEADVTPYHSCMFRLEEFVGEIKIQGSTEDNPEHNENDWIDIASKSFEEPTDENVLLSGEGKFIWVRFQYKRENESSSKVSSIQYRN